MVPPEQFFNLGVSLALGLLIGTERGWEQRQAQEGSRIAGIRTFGLIGLMGGVTALLGRQAGPLLLAVGLASFALVLAAVILRDTPTHTSRGATTILALFATFILGAVAGWGEAPVIAITAAAVMTIMLGMKKSLHNWLTTIDTEEMNAAFKLLLVSAVVLPSLPNESFGPWGALNPYQIWWLVVLISAISFVGFFAIKTISPERGILLTSIFGGLASSTAIAVSFSRLGRDNAALQKMLAAGVIISSTLMAPRMIIVSGTVSPDLALYLAPPLILMTLAGAGAAALLFRDGQHTPALQKPLISAAFSLTVPLRFGLVFAGVLIAVAAVRQFYGEHGLYGVAALAGLTDVDAITLSLARNIAKGLAVDIAARAAIIASLANTFVKFAIVAVLCGGNMARRTGLGFAAIALAGIIGIFYGNFGLGLSPAAFAP
jgi:uncharacterized membrane protein (DUF4010 family)